MYNPYYYPSKEDSERASQKQQTSLKRHLLTTQSLAQKSRHRTAETLKSSTNDSNTSASDVAPVHALQNSSPSFMMQLTRASTWKHPGTPWVPYSQYQFRERDAAKEVSDNPFCSTRWKTSSMGKKTPDLPAAESESPYLAQPKYSDPGFNRRNGEFCSVTHAYNLREREKAREVSEIPWRTKGARTEGERIAQEIEKYCRASLPPEAPPKPEKDDPATFVGEMPMQIRWSRVSRLFDRTLTRAELMEPYLDHPHPDCAKYSLVFRPRELSKEVPLKDPIRKRIGFSTAVRHGEDFTKYEWQPL